MVICLVIFFGEKQQPAELIIEVQPVAFSITTPGSYRDFSMLVE